MKIFTLKVFTLLLLIIGTTDAYGQDGCNFIYSIPIEDWSFVDIPISITGAANNDLSSPTQGVCGVTVHFEHEYIGDLELVLTSPYGQSITLLGPIGFYGMTDYSTWDISFVPCSDTPSPDPGHAPKYKNNDSWGKWGDFNGSYHPYLGCLEDFNIGPVNGIWMLQWLDDQYYDSGDILGFSISFCDPTGVDCMICSAEAGTISPGGSITECEGSPSLNLSLTPTYSGGDSAPDPADEYDYTYLIVDDNGIIQAINPSADLTGMPPGDYTVCGLSFNIADVGFLPKEGDSYNDLSSDLAAGIAGFCGDLSDNCISVTIQEGPPDVEIDSTICLGESVMWGGVEISVDGDYVQEELDPNTGCSYDHILHLTVEEPTDLIFDSIGPFCETDAIVNLPDASNGGISGTWNVNPFDPSASVGQTTLTFTPSDGGCVNDYSVVVDVVSSITPTFTQIGPLCETDAPVLLPTTDENGMTGSWNVSTFDPANGSGTVTFTPDAGQCGSSTNMDIVVTSSIAPVFTQIGPLCETDAPVLLPTTDENGMTGSWNVALFDPANGSGTVTFTPDAGQCGETTTMDIAVNECGWNSFF